MNIWTKLQYYIFHKKMQKQSARKVHFCTYEQAERILIVYESDHLERNPFIKELVRIMMMDKKDVTTWGFINKKDVASPILPQSRILEARDLRLWGDLTDQVKNDLSQTHFDMLIDLTQNPCLPLHYVTLYANSKFKVGRRIEDGLLDFMIDMPAQENAEILYHQIMHYLNTIKTV